MHSFADGLLHNRRVPYYGGSALVRALLAVLIASSATLAGAQETDQAAADAEEQENNGTDPTRPTGSALVSYEHFDLRGGINTDTVSMEYTHPLSAATTLRMKVPLVSNDALGDASVGVGDLAFRLQHVVTRTAKYGVVVNAEMVFDTADGPVRGTGQNVLKTGLIYARFLKGGHIFAPAVVHSLSLWGENGRADVNSTTIDFYFVPIVLYLGLERQRHVRQGESEFCKGQIEPPQPTSNANPIAPLASVGLFCVEYVAILSRSRPVGRVLRSRS